MNYCFNGNTLLPVATGERIRRFQEGLNPAVHHVTVTAPLELGPRGKFMDCDKLMEYAVTQAGALTNKGAVLANSSITTQETTGFRICMSS